MITEEKRNKMYEGLNEKNQLTTKELKSYGLDGNDISALVKKGTIKRVERGLYSFQAVDELYHYGKKLLVKREYDKANLYFQKCHELDENYLDVYFPLFFNCIRNKEYQKAFTYFDVCFQTDNPNYEIDNKIYLYLLNLITDIPEKYSPLIKELTFEDIEVREDDSRYKDVPQQNKLRFLILNQHADSARKICLSIPKSDRVKISNLLIGTLLTQVLETQKKEIYYLIEMLNKNNYEEALTQLETQIEKRNGNRICLKKLELSLLRDIVEINKTGVIPKMTNGSDSLFSAILNKDYSLALSLNEQYLRKHQLNAKYNLIHLLLRKLVEITNNLKSTDTETKQLESDQMNEVFPNSELDHLFLDCIQSLYAGNVEYFLEQLSKYLEKINKKDAELLIIKLLKFSILEKDTTYSKPLMVLNLLSLENLNIDMDNYLSPYYEIIEKNKKELAKLSISKNQSFKQSDSKATITPNQEKHSRNMSSNNPAISQNKEFPSKSEPKKFLASSINPPEKEKDSLADINRIKDRMPKLRKRGILLLDFMSEEKINKIHEIVKEIPDMDSFTIGKEKNSQVVLRFRSFTDRSSDLVQLKQEGDYAYYTDKNYPLCIEKYRELIKLGTFDVRIYMRLGLAYMKTRQDSLAIDYLTVANELAKEQRPEWDFSDLILYLKQDSSDENRKPYTHMTLAQFENDIDDTYGIKNIETVEKLLVSGMNIHQISEQLGFSEEEKKLVSLIIAKKYYARGKIEQGNQYLKLAERGKNKTQFVKDQVEEVKRNKKYYKYRKLVLIPSSKRES